MRWGGRGEKCMKQEIDEHNHIWISMRSEYPYEESDHTFTASTSFRRIERYNWETHDLMIFELEALYIYLLIGDSWLFQRAATMKILRRGSYSNNT